ncbi:hypothetical protein [Enterococcus faecalis]|nr:hypothetical protein [Enterococcus faecalis]
MLQHISLFNAIIAQRPSKDHQKTIKRPSKDHQKTINKNARALEK